jgi:hypothetical protein
MIPMMLISILSAAASVWSATVPFNPGGSVTLDARAAPLLISSLEMTDRSDGKVTAATLTITAANVGNHDAEAVITATLLDARGEALATEDESVEIEEGDVKKIRFRVALPKGKNVPIASVKVAVAVE